MKNFLGELEKSSYLLEKSCHEPESLDKTRQNNIDETTAELGEKVIWSPTPPQPDDQHCELSEERVELTANSNELIFTRVLIVLPSSNAFRTPRRGWSAVWIFGINDQH